MRERYERFQWDFKDLTRYLRDSTKEIESIKIRDMETYSNLEGVILELMEAQSKLNTRDL